MIYFVKFGKSVYKIDRKRAFIKVYNGDKELYSGLWFNLDQRLHLDRCPFESFRSAMEKGIKCFL